MMADLCTVDQFSVENPTLTEPHRWQKYEYVVLLGGFTSSQFSLLMMADLHTVDQFSVENPTLTEPHRWQQDEYEVLLGGGVTSSQFSCALESFVDL
jgi:hypothetical protein